MKHLQTSYENTQMYVFYYAGNLAKIYMSLGCANSTEPHCRPYKSPYWIQVKVTPTSAGHYKWIAAILLQQKLNDGWIECSITHLLCHISPELFECYKNKSLKRLKKA